MEDKRQRRKWLKVTAWMRSSDGSLARDATQFKTKAWTLPARRGWFSNRCKGPGGGTIGQAARAWIRWLVAMRSSKLTCFH
jgi:hypothetical protein